MPLLKLTYLQNELLKFYITKSKPQQFSPHDTLRLRAIQLKLSFSSMFKFCIKKSVGRMLKSELTTFKEKKKKFTTHYTYFKLQKKLLQTIF